LPTLFYAGITKVSPGISASCLPLRRFAPVAVAGCAICGLSLEARPDALAFAALFDRFMQNLMGRYLGCSMQYFAAVEPQRL
jgi:hypothetical protein